MAIEMLQGPRAVAQRPVAGKFTLPVGFDTRKWAAQWVKTTDTESMRGPQYLTNIPATADGWSVYKGEKGDQKPSKVNLGKEGEYILMVRPKDIQTAVNALYGNLGKQMAQQEVEGTTVANQDLQDPGMLPVNRLRKLGVETEADELPANQFAPTPVHIGGSHKEAATET